MTGSVSVRVPATVGNFAFDGILGALALEASLNVKVNLRTDAHVGIRYFGDDGERVPRDRSNLVVRAMQLALSRAGLRFPGGDFEIYSNIPVGVGFGSSAAATLAGIIAADRLFRLGLHEDAIFELANLCESKNENVRAAWFGGFAPREEAQSGATQPHRSMVHDFVLTAVIPCARGQEVRGFEEALKICVDGEPTVFRCGSGPAVGIVSRADAAAIVSEVSQTFATRGVRTTTAEFRVTQTGARDWNNSRAAAAGVGAGSEPRRKPTLIPV